MKYSGFFVIMLLLAQLASQAELIPEYTPSDYDASGAEFTILHSEEYSILPDEVTGEIVNDAQFKAWNRVADAHNVRLSYKLTDDPAPEKLVWMSILAADPICDIVLADANKLAPTAANGGFMNLKSFPEIILNGVWWNQSLNSQLEVGTEKKLYTAANDISPMNYGATSCILYEYDVLGDEPLNLARRGNWTLDKLLELAKENGGFVSSEPSSETALLLGAGAEFIGKKDTTVSLYPRAAKVLSAVNKIEELFDIGGDTACIAVGSVGNIKKIQYREFSGLLPNIENVRAVPLPKLDKKDDYRSPITDAYELLAIPITCIDTVKTGTILNALQYESYANVIPAMYDESMQTKTMKHEEIGEMIDLIRSGLTLDRRLPYNCATLDSTDIAYAIDAGDFLAKFTTAQAKMQQQLDKSLQTYNELTY